MTYDAGHPCCAEYGQMRREIESLRQERDTWHARAFAMFWKLPGDLTLGELQDDAERARVFIQTCDVPTTDEITTEMERLSAEAENAFQDGFKRGIQRERQRCTAIIQARADKWNAQFRAEHAGPCAESLAEECEDIIQTIRNTNVG
jgi:hypothetical protein